MTRTEKVNMLIVGGIYLLVFLVLMLSLFVPAWGGTVTLNWQAPTKNTDGSPLEDLAGYKIYVGSSSGMYGGGLDVKAVTQYALDLPEGKWYIVVTAYDFLGHESAKSNEIVREVITVPMPPVLLDEKVSEYSFKDRLNQIWSDRQSYAWTHPAGYVY